MDDVDIKIFRSKGVTMIDGRRFFASFDCRAGEQLNPVLCILYFCVDRRFFEELALFDSIGFDINDYHVRHTSYTVFTLRPLEGYTNEKMEDLFCHIIKRYETMS